MLYPFFGDLGKIPDQVAAAEVFGFAHGVGLSGKPPGSVTSVPALPASVASTVS